MLLEGLQLPLTTPFYADGRLNLHKLAHNVERYSLTPVAGLVSLSDPGEPSLLSDEETRQALRCVVEAAAEEKVLIAGVSRDSVVGTLDLAEYAATLGYDAVLVKRPSVLPCNGNREVSTKALLTYFQVLADRSPLPMVLYSAASRPGAALSTEIIAELAGHPRIIGLVDDAAERVVSLKAATMSIKREVNVTSIFAAVTSRMRVGSDASTSNGLTGLISADVLTGGEGVAVAPMRPVVRTRAKLVGFQILVSSTAALLEGLLAGAVGAMPGFAASAPQACYEVLAAWKDGDEGLAREKQIRLRDVVARVEAKLGIAGIKYGCDLNGYYGGWPRLPLLPLSREECAEVEELMQGLRN